MEPHHQLVFFNLDHSRDRARHPAAPSNRANATIPRCDATGRKVGDMGTVVTIMTRNNWSNPMSAVETPSRPMAVTRCRRMAGLGARASASQRAMRGSLQSFPCPGRSWRHGT